MYHSYEFYSTFQKIAFFLLILVVLLHINIKTTNTLDNGITKLYYKFIEFLTKLLQMEVDCGSNILSDHRLMKEMKDYGYLTKNGNLDNSMCQIGRVPNTIDSDKLNSNIYATRSAYSNTNSHITAYSMPQINLNENITLLEIGQFDSL